MNYMSAFGVRVNTWSRADRVRNPSLEPLRRQPSAEYVLAAAIVLIVVSVVVVAATGF